MAPQGKDKPCQTVAGRGRGRGSAIECKYRLTNKSAAILYPWRVFV